MRCVRCNGAGTIPVLQKVEIHPDKKTCSYRQKDEICRRCEGQGFIDARDIPPGLVGR